VEANVLNVPTAEMLLGNVRGGTAAEYEFTHKHTPQKNSVPILPIFSEKSNLPSSLSHLPLKKEAVESKFDDSTVGRILDRITFLCYNKEKLRRIRRNFGVLKKYRPFRRHVRNGPFGEKKRGPKGRLYPA
jgi:hypothetical protein